MSHLAALLLCALLPVPQDPEEVSLEIRNGRTEGLLFGFSVVMVGGSNLRELWTLKADGTLLLRSPEGSFEDFQKRDLSAEEKKRAGRYAIEGKTFKFSSPSGEAREGETQLDASGRLKGLKIGPKIFFPIRPGVDFPLVGYYATTSSFSSLDGKAMTMSFTNYSFFAGGFFATESGAGTFCRQLELKTRESSRNVAGGIEYSVETFQQEATKFFGGTAKSRVGRFELKGSGLVLRFDDGKVENRFIAQMGSSRKPPVTIVIGEAPYEGTPGQFGSAPAGAAAPAPAAAPLPASVAVCVHDHFELRTPAGVSAAETVQDGEKNFTFTPAGAADPSARLTVVAYSVALDDPAVKAEDPAFAAAVRAQASRALGKDLEPAGVPQPLLIDGRKALRVPLKTEFNGSPLRFDGVLCPTGGVRAVFLAAIGNDAGMKKHEPMVAALLGALRVTGVSRIAAGGLEFDLPGKWTFKELEQDGTRMVALLPPGTTYAPDTNDFLFTFATEASTLKSATDAEAVRKLRDQIQQMAPGLERQGEPLKLTAAGEPAIRLDYSARNAEGVNVLLQAYAVVKGGREVALLLLGPEAKVSPHAAALRRAFESLTLKK